MRLNRVIRNCTFIGLLALHSFFLAVNCYLHSPTLDEPAHLAAGISHWQLNRFELYRGNPPLVRMVAAIPTLMAGINCDWKGYSETPGSRSEFVLGSKLIDANGQRSYYLLMIARWACIPFSWVGCAICFLWARELYGDTAGWVAAILWCFSPNILGHAALITPDAPATALGLAACHSFWKWLKEPTWSLTYLTGVLLGAAELTKTTLVVLFPLWPILWLCYRWPDRASMRCRDWSREAMMLLARFALALFIVNLGYGFEDSFTRLSEFEFVSKTLKGNNELLFGNRFEGSLVSDLPVPFPKQYVLGIDIQRKVFEHRGKPSYLRGRWQETGWWYYYLYALAIKVPLGTLGLCLMATWGCCNQRIVNRLCGKGSVAKSPVPCHAADRAANCKTVDEIVLLVPAIVMLAFVSSQTGYSENMRYVLPIFPFVFVWCSRSFRDTGTIVSTWQRIACWRPNCKSIDCFPTRPLATGLLIWSVASSLLIYPHSLSYFNECVGGPRHGADHLLGSNLDWGQDIRYLQWWMDTHPEARPMFVDLVCLFDPKSLGLDVRRLSETYRDSSNLAAESAYVTPGWYAVSVNRLRQSPSLLSQSASGRLVSLLSRLQPKAMIGYTIYVYHVEALRTERSAKPMGDEAIDELR